MFEALKKTLSSRPDKVCPKCGSTVVEFYDPLFFAPIRAFYGRRRFVCRSCNFVWRSSRKSHSMIDRFRQGS